MLAWRNKTSPLEQPKQVNHVTKKTIIPGVSSKLTIQILLSPNRFKRWGSNESRLFSRSMFVDRRRSEIFAILTFPEEKRSSFKNCKSRSVFLTKYSKRLTDQPLSKHYMVKLDLYASERQDIHGLQREQPNECRSFLFAAIKDRGSL